MQNIETRHVLLRVIEGALHERCKDTRELKCLIAALIQSANYIQPHLEPTNAFIHKTSQDYGSLLPP